MSPDRLGELLTAYLDGELSPRQCQAVARLLETSPSARAQLEQLQEAVSALRPLRRQRPYHDLAESVLHAIAERRLHPGRRLIFAEAGVPPWFGAAVAAAVLLLVCTATLVYFGLPARRQARVAAALGKRSSSAAPSMNASPAMAARTGKSMPPAPLPAPAPEQRPAEIGPPVAKSPPRHTDNELASPPTPESKVDVFTNKDQPAALKLPLRLAGRHPAQQLLREKLKQARAFRVELRCLGHGKALAHVQARLQAQGIQLLIDPTASSRASAAGGRRDFVIYSESLTARELGNLLEQLGAADDRALQKKERQFGDFLLRPYSDEDRLELATLLKADPALLPSPHSAPLGVDVRQPLEDATADDLANVLKGKGIPRPGKATIVAKPARTAIMLAAHPDRSQSSQSKAIRRFLESRMPRRPASVPVLLVLRGANG